MLQEISTYNLPADFARTEQQIIRNMTVEQHKELAQKYIDPTRMYYVIAGDAATQADPLKSLGFGNPIIVK
jgi:zinc protease